MSLDNVQPAFVDARTAAKMLSISVRSLWRLCSIGKIKRIRFGPKTIRFRVDELNKLGSTTAEQSNQLCVKGSEL